MAHQDYCCCALLSSIIMGYFFFWKLLQKNLVSQDSRLNLLEIRASVLARKFKFKQEGEIVLFSDFSPGFWNSCMQNIRGFTVLDQKLQISLWSFHDCTLKQRFSSASLPASRQEPQKLKPPFFSQKFFFEKWTFAGLEKTEESYDIKNSRKRSSQCFENDPKNV